MKPVTIRRATPADVDAISANHRATHAQHVAAFEGYDDAPWDAQITARLKDPTADAPDFTVFVAELGGHFAGHLAMHPFTHAEGGASQHISDISVREGDRGYGVGRALVEAAEDQARRDGTALMLAMIWPGNTPSRDFFAAMGYASRHDEKRGLVVAAKSLARPRGPAKVERFLLIGVVGLVVFILAALAFGMLG
ncbi:MAG: GNAT family N-acetyltransferase [Vannielia sp.]|uniref:GNAT family N-acetyltransferase n=1 Tax=Vannielia sp. TaxID=2813045 RepID=UPI003B8CF9E9